MKNVKKSELVETIREVIAEYLVAAMEVFEEDLEPMLDFGSPTKVIGPYKDWTPEDFAKAQAIFGPQLEDYIAKNEIKDLEEMESTEV